MGSCPLQTWDPMFCLSSELWRRLQGQSLLQRYERVLHSKKFFFKKPCSPYLVFVSLVEDDRSNRLQEETEENNFIEPEAPRGTKPWSRVSKPEPPGLPPPTTKPPTEDLQNEVVNTHQMCKLKPNCLF